MTSARVSAADATRQATGHAHTRDEMWTSARAGAYLDLSVSEMAKKRMRGDGPPFIKLGPTKQASVRYRRSDVEEWLNQRMRRSTSDQGGQS